MTIRVNANSLKNAMGTMFLLAAAFFVCSTLVSMRSVFADPVAPSNALPQRAGRVSPRSTANTTNRATVSRATTRASGASPVAQTRTTASRGTGTNRAVSSRGVAATRTTGTTTRGVAARSKNVTNRTTNNRAVRARTANTPSRVSATGSVMAGSRASTNTTYAYLNSKLYTGSYSNIIDSTTGLISADAYSNCMESYYTCMDEICTARSDTKGRCSCAGRATNFLEAEEQLEAANEELIKLSGQLSLLISTKGKGKDLSSAFSLTEAEQVMNCVSYKDNVQGGKVTDAEWYEEHPTVDSTGNKVTSGMPSYCSNNSYGFDIKNIDGSSSDILAQLQAWADAKDLAKQYSTDNVGVLSTTVNYLSDVVNNLSSINSNSDPATIDTLANKWGYKLFEYAHNNVCGRVLDSCFNGIYEACGTPVSVTDSDGKTHNKCGNGATSSCPFNYNSYISVITSGENSGDIKLNERGSGNSATTASSASCFGYSTTSTVRGVSTASASSDPYATLRGPVADARRSVMQKYLLDANAACDTYGNALKQTAQNINYQKIAAEQALQQKRLEFTQEAETQRLADANTAIENFNECISEIWDCYEEYTDEENWTTARIKAYCSQVAQVPHCYETMICSPLSSQLAAVVDVPDNDSCTIWDSNNEYVYESASGTGGVKACRNIVSISEILYGTGAQGTDIVNKNDFMTKKSGLSSRGVREGCLLEALGCGSSSYAGEGYCLRTWSKTNPSGNNN